MTKTVLITGAGGFLGGHLLRQLSHSGVHIRGFDITPTPETLAKNAEWIEGSILDMDALNAAMQGVHHVYHMAAIAHLGVPQTQRYEQINHIGTCNVIAAARAASVEHLLITSTEVILRGWQDDSSAPLTEAEPLPAMADMAGPYCRSKLAAEIATRSAMDAGQPISILYPTVPIGAEDVNLTAPAAMIKAFITAPPPAFLDCVFNFVAAEDVARAHILAANQPAGGRYILGGQTMEMADLLAIIAPHSAKSMPKKAVPYPLALMTAHIAGLASKITGKAPLASLEGVRLARHKTQIDSAHAKAALGWDVMPAKTALENSINWLKNQ